MITALPLRADQDYPLLNLFWTMLWLFIWILWIFLVIRVIMDVFRSRDMGGWAKAGWTVFIVVLPLIGVLVYLIARGKGMADRDTGAATEAERSNREYIRSVAGSQNSVADEVNKLATLRDKGVLTEQEFQSQKARLLA